MNSTLKGTAARDAGGGSGSASAGWLIARRFAEVREQARRSGHDASLDGIRGLAVGLVFLVHVYRIIGPLSPQEAGIRFALQAVSVTGQVGVHLFFVLSGFLIYGLVLERKPSYGRFIRRRLLRIYPTFLAVVAVNLSVCFLVPSLSKLPAGFWASVEYLARAVILLPGLTPTPPFVTVAWTLRSEMAFYLLVGCLVFLPPFFRLGRAARAGLFAAALAVQMFVLQESFLASMFLFGILAREAYGALRASAPGVAGAAYATAFAAVPASFYMFLPELSGEFPGLPALITEASPTLRFLVLGPILGLFVLFAALPNNPISRLGAWRPVRAFGIISYSYYLSHGIGIHLVERAIQGLGPSESHSFLLALAVFLGSFVLTVFIALFFFLTVEFPVSIRKRIVY